jgi:hypothetical protein
MDINAMAFSGTLPTSEKKPIAQPAHLVFAATKANAEKTKRAVFYQRSDINLMNK